MAIIETLQNLLEYPRRYLFREELCLNNPIKELSSSANFGDQVDISAIFEVLIKFEDMWVIELLEDLDFLLESLHVLDLLFGNFLHRSLLTCDLVLA